MDYTFNFNPSAMDSSIACAKKASGIITEVDSMIKELSNMSIPKGFPAFDKLNSSKNIIDKNVTDISELGTRMENIKGLLENADSSQYSMIRDLEASGMKMIELHGQTGRFTTGGYLFVPQDFDGTEELPMMVWMGGDRQYSKHEIFNHNSNGFPLLLKDGNYSANAIIYLPALVEQNAINAAGPKGGLQQSVEDIAKEYNVDTDRISAWGYSDGARAALRLAAETPNYYSAVVSMGADTAYLDQLKQNTDTKIIYYCGKGDGSNGSCGLQTEEINNSGGQAIYYYSEDEGHFCNYAMSEELLDDVLSVEKGTKVDESILGKHDVTGVQKSSMIKANGEYNPNPEKADYYQRMTDKKVSKEELIEKVKDELEGKNKNNNPAGDNDPTKDPTKTGNQDPDKDPTADPKTPTGTPYSGGGGPYGGGIPFIMPQQQQPETTKVEPIKTEKVELDPVPEVTPIPTEPIPQTSVPIESPKVTPTPTQTSSTTTTTGPVQTVNNYYYGSDSSSGVSSLSHTDSNMEIPDIKPIISEPIDLGKEIFLESEPTIEPFMLDVSEGVNVVEPIADPSVVINKTSTKSSVIPVLGAFATATAAGLAYNSLKKDDEKKEDSEEENSYPDVY